MGTLSRHKKTKLGMLPGDVSIRVKAKMLEKKDRRLPESMDPTGQVGKRLAKAYKKDVVKMANRRARHQAIEMNDGD